MRARILTVAILATVLSTALLAGQPPPQGRFAFERTVTTAGAGPRKLPVDHPLLVGGSPFRVSQKGDRFIAEEGLADLRLFDIQGQPVPYLLVHSRGREPRWLTGRLVEVASTKKTSGFEADFGRAQQLDAVRIEGIPAPFLKRFLLEGSGDRTRWTSLAADATLFDLPAEKLRQTQVGFTPGEYRYVRVTWDDTNSAQVPLPRTVRARPAVDDEGSIQMPLELEFERVASEPGTSRFRVRLPAVGLPIVALELDVAGGHVFRTAAVTESRLAGFEAAPVELGRASLSRIVQQGVAASDLRIPITPPAESEVHLLIDDGSNPPLEVKRVLARLAELPSIYFEAPAGDVVARYGSRMLQRPVYDLQAVRPSVDLARVLPASWGAPKALLETEAISADDRTPEPGGTVDPGGFRNVRPLPGDPAGLVSLQLDAAVLAHSRGPAARFADVRVLDAADRQIPYLLERRDEPLQVELTLAPADTGAAELKRAPGRQLSVYKLSLPYPNLPPATLVLETTGRVFRRTVQLGIERAPDRRHRDTWFQVLASDTWRHADQQSPAPAMSLPIAPLEGTDVWLVIDEGDNAPLPITAARLLLPSYRLRYHQPAGGTLRLAYGRDDLQPPEYDFTLLAQQVMGAPARELTPGSESSQGAGPHRRELLSPVTFWFLMGGAVIVLLGLILKLVRQGTKA